jgi:hypothetical protein
MLSAAISYQVPALKRSQTIEKVKAVLEKHPWYTNQWQARLQDVPVPEHVVVLVMQASRWGDGIRTQDKQYYRRPWHYINWPFKPEGQPVSVEIRESEPVNILTILLNLGSERRHLRHIIQATRRRTCIRECWYR